MVNPSDLQNHKKNFRCSPLLIHFQLSVVWMCYNYCIVCCMDALTPVSSVLWMHYNYYILCFIVTDHLLYGCYNYCICRMVVLQLLDHLSYGCVITTGSQSELSTVQILQKAHKA